MPLVVTSDHLLKSGFDSIVCDEIYMSGPFILNKISKFAEENPELVIIGSTDNSCLA